MRRFRSRFWDCFHKGQRGAALVLFAGGLAIFCGLVGLSVDVGMLVATRTDLQKQADAAALAGAQELPSTSGATWAAWSYINRNQGQPWTADVSFSQTYTSNDTITVTANKRVNYAFMKVLGLTGANVSAKAKVRANSYTGGNGLVPWGLIASNNSNSKLLQNSCYLGQQGGVPLFKQNTQCTLKYGAGTNSGGDFGSLALDGTGSNVYGEAIANGSQSFFKMGDKVDPQTGAMVGKTTDGINDRLSRPAPASCPGNARDDVLKTNLDGSVSIRPGCESSPRIIVIPVVDLIDNSNNPQKSTILGFAYMYLTGSTGNGGQAQVTGEFVKFVTELPNSVYQSAPGSGATMVKLMQ